MSKHQSYFGKYRGKVSDVQDPMMLGRIKANVPSVTGEADTGWAMPCAPFGGSGMGMFVLPDVGAGVWIEFEGGDPDYPIWSGCWWAAASEVPPALLAPPYQKTLIKTKGGNSILLDDTPGAGGITLETSGGQKIKLLGTGLEIDNGMGSVIKMTGPKFEVNNGGLEVI